MKAFTLIETVVAVGVFAVLVSMTSVLLVGALQGAKKAAATATVRGEGANAIRTMEQMLRFATDVTVCDGKQIDFVQYQGASTTSFSCGVDYIASGSGILTAPTVTVKPNTCAITCDTADPLTAKAVTIKFDLEKTGAAFVSETATAQFETQVTLRNRE